MSPTLSRSGPSVSRFHPLLLCLSRPFPLRPTSLPSLFASGFRLLLLKDDWKLRELMHIPMYTGTHGAHDGGEDPPSISQHGTDLGRAQRTWGCGIPPSCSPPSLFQKTVLCSSSANTSRTTGISCFRYLGWNAERNARSPSPGNLHVGSMVSIRICTFVGPADL